MRKIKTIFMALCLTLACFGICIEASAAEKTYTSSIGMEFILIPAGSFMMGMDPNKEVTREKLPQRKVTISKPFYIGKYPVTQAQWVALMESNPSEFKGPNNPVERVSWEATQEFIRRLNAKEGRNRYRLPTEAEWEYAARAGTSSVYYFGDDKNELSNYVWYKGNSGGTTKPVGQKPPNAWGLFDVFGNVWEWVQDWSGDEHYTDIPVTDPKGPTDGSHRIIRGGSWHSEDYFCSSGFWYYDTPYRMIDETGFRLAFSP